MSHLQHIRVGILIPTYNRIRFLKEALHSALAQTHHFIQIIVIDNAGKDGTKEYIENIDDERVRYVLNEDNIGMIGSINKGIRLMESDTEWCTILSDDDLLDERYVETALQAAERYSSRAVVNCNRVFINVNGKRIRDARTVSHEQDALDYIESRLKRRTETYLTGILFNRESFDQIGGYPPFSTGIATDDAFIFSLALRDRLVHCSQAKAFVRFHKGAESVSCSNVIEIINTISEFRTYCEQVAVNSGLTDQIESRLKPTLARYAVALNSGCWLKNLHDVLQGKDKTAGGDVSDLCSIVDSRKSSFTSRVRFDCYCMSKLGLCPESNLIYRLFWDLMTNFSISDQIVFYLRSD